MLSVIPRTQPLLLPLKQRSSHSPVQNPVASRASYIRSGRRIS
uniref:Uncharacterized protein n=1 Tax=Arundo donax TaxID=35708 RepID=A0A0A9HKR3_ARUDO